MFIIIIIIMYCVLLYYATCATLQIIDKLYGSSLSLQCARSYNIPERREDLNPGCVQLRCQPMTWIWRMHNSFTGRTSMPLTIDCRGYL